MGSIKNEDSVKRREVERPRESMKIWDMPVEDEMDVLESARCGISCGDACAADAERVRTSTTQAALLLCYETGGSVPSK